MEPREFDEDSMTTFNNLLEDFADLCFASRERQREWTAIPAANKLERHQWSGHRLKGIKANCYRVLHEMYFEMGENYGTTKANLEKLEANPSNNQPDKKIKALEKKLRETQKELSQS
jgi:hypothetical protein